MTKRLGQIKSLQSIADLEEDILTTKKMAEILGISESGVLKRIKRDTLPAHKNGHMWYFLKTEVVRLLRAT